MKTLHSQDYWDIALAVVLIIISIVTLVGTASIREFNYEPLGPTFLPKALAYCFFVMSGLILVKVAIRQIRERKEELTEPGEKGVEEVEGFQRHPWLAVIAVGLISLFISSLHFLGFRVTSLIFMIVLGTLLIRFENKSNKKRNVISLIIIALVLSFGLYFIFREILGVRVP